MEMWSQKESRAEISEGGWSDIAETILSVSPLGVAVTDTSRRIIRVNEAFSRMTGFSGNGVTRRNLFELLGIPLPDMAPAAAGAPKEIFRGKCAKRGGGSFLGKLEVFAPNSNAEGDLLVFFVEDLARLEIPRERPARLLGKYRILLKHHLVGSYEVDAKTYRFISVNDDMCWFTGYSREELLSMDARDLIRPEDREQHQKRRAGKVEGQDIQEFVQYRLRKKDGEEIDILCFPSFHYVDGELSTVKVIVFDISDPVRIAESLGELIDTLETLSKKVPAGLFIADLDESNTLLWANEKFEQLLGFSSEEFERVPGFWAEYVHPEDLDDLVTYRSSLQGDEKGEESGHLYRMQRKDGRPIWCWENIGLVRNPAGRPEYLVGVLFDVTGKLKTMEERRNREKMMQVLINGTPGMAVLVDRAGTVLACNHFFAQEIGLRSNLIRGTCAYDLLNAKVAEVGKQYVDQVFSSGQPVEWEFRTPKRIFENTAYPCYDSQGNVWAVAVYIFNVTEKRRIDDELKAKSIKLQEANSALKIMLKGREEDKQELEERILTNVKKLILPTIDKCKGTRLDPQQRAYLESIERNVMEMVSPFAHTLSAKYRDLTPREIEVADLIRAGKTTKEIAEIMRSSKSVIDFHRYNIRKKLGINNQKANLRSYLLSLA